MQGRILLPKKKKSNQFSKSKWTPDDFYSVCPKVNLLSIRIKESQY